MNHRPSLRRTVLILFLVVSLPTGVGAQYLRVTGSSVNVRQGPTLESAIVGAAEEGDIFLSQGRTGDWFAVKLFSAEDRYIHVSLAEPTESLPALPVSEEIRRNAFEGFLRAGDRAFIEASRKILSTETRTRNELQQLLEDRYHLRICHSFPGIHPIHFAKIREEGLRKRWDRVGEVLFP
jgi:hypothetical protein